MLRSLLQYAEATPGARRTVAAAVVAHLTAEAGLLRSDPVYKWASTRWPTFVQCALYAIDHLVPAFGHDAGVMPLGGAATTALLMNASRLFRSKVCVCMCVCMCMSTCMCMCLFRSKVCTPGARACRARVRM